MKVMIVVDLEGAACIDDGRAMMPYFPELYAVAREEITQDVNAAVRGLRRAGATEIVVADGHGARLWPETFNVLPDKLEPEVALVRGAGALEETAGLDAVAMVGMHCRNGTPVGFLGHTVSGFTALKINGAWFGESEMVAATAGQQRVPAILVTGDDATIVEAQHFMPWLEGVVVKVATGRASCECLPGQEARASIERGAEHALESQSRMYPLVVSRPVTAEVFFPSADHADLAASLPRAVRAGETSLTYQADDYLEASRFFMTALRLASGVRSTGEMRYLMSDKATAARLEAYKRRRTESFWEEEPWLVADLTAGD
jgi:D-amino peptidase